MKKIMTAINNPKLNEELKKEKNFEIIGKDIQYKEAILEVLEQNADIDLIIISEQIPGDIKIEILLENIKRKNNKIKIIFILEKENKDLEKILIKNNIKDIYYNNRINLKELIEIIDKKEINMEEEIIKLKKIIEEKNNKEIKRKKHINKIKRRERSKRKKELIKGNMSTKIITFSGNDKSGKTTLSLIIGQCLSDKNYKVLLIDGDFEKKDLTTLLKKEKKKNNKNKKFYKNKKNLKKIYFIKIKNEKMKWINREKNIYNYKIKSIIKMNTKKINKNLYLFYGLTKILKNKKEEKIILDFFQIEKTNYDFILVDLSKNNYDKNNKEILKKSDINFVLLEANLLGIKELQRLLDQYIIQWKIYINSLHIIKNKKNFLSINKKIISKYLSFKNKVFEIKENKFYYLLTNHYLKRKILLKNKIVKRDINKIVNKILF